MLDSLTRNAVHVLVAAVILISYAAAAQADAMSPPVRDDGVVRVKSAYSVDESVARLKKDIADKGINFLEVDQQKLAADAGIKTQRSTLIVFGNPPLGTQFITANPNAALDWPVRVLVTQDDAGNVWAVYTDFEWIKHRHNITNRDAQFKMASEVIGSITSSIKGH